MDINHHLHPAALSWIFSSPVLGVYKRSRFVKKVAQILRWLLGLSDGPV